MADLYPHDDLGRPTGYIFGTPQMYCRAAVNIVDELARNKDLLEQLAEERKQESCAAASLKEESRTNEKQIPG